MNTHPHAELAARAVNDALSRGSARPVPSSIVLLELSEDADRETAIGVVRIHFASQQLEAGPVGLWQGADELLVGPDGVLCPTALIPDTASLDTRVYVTDGKPARVVLSWLDGPTAGEVGERLANHPETGLDVELVREEFDALLNDVLDAAITTRAEPVRLTTQPVLERVRAVRDGRDIY